MDGEMIGTGLCLFEVVVDSNGNFSLDFIVYFKAVRSNFRPNLPNLLFLCLQIHNSKLI